MKNVVIIGGGPAGVSAGIYLTRAGIENIVITNNTGTLKKVEKIENYYGIEEPITGVELIKRGLNQYKNLGGNVIEDEIIGLNFEDKLVVSGLKNTYKADIVIIATGVSRLLPVIKGLTDGERVSYCAICDAFFYRKKEVAVIGNGNYAKHEAEVLEHTSSKVTILTNGKVTEFESNVNVNLKKIDHIERTTDKMIVTFVDGEVATYDGIFIAEGIAGATALAKKIGAEVENNKIVVDENMKTRVPGVYAIGDCTGGILQVSKAVYDGTKAAMNIIKESKNDGR